MSGPFDPHAKPAPVAPPVHASPAGWGSAPGDREDTSDRPWGWRDLWRHGGLGAAVVVAGSAWLLAILWFVSNDAPSAGGTPPQIVIVDPAPTAVPIDDPSDETATGVR